MRPGAEEEAQGAPSRHKNHRALPLVALLLMVPAQSLGVIAMLYAFPGIEGKILSGVSRLWMLGFPMFWTLRVERARPRVRGPRRRGVVVGLASGALILVAILGAYALSRDHLDAGAFVDRARMTGFDRPVPFALVIAYIILANSFLEEYVWRWFVYRQVEAIMPAGLADGPRRAGAILIAAMLFTIHHVFALSAWVGLPLVVLGVVGVFLGAVIWSAIYAFERSLWPCYLSHVLADLAIMLVGYDVVFRSGG